MSRDEFWLDYVENEIDKQTRAEMKSLLKRSPKDQETVKELSDTKTLLKESEVFEAEACEDFFDDLHDRIMAGIEKTEVKEKPKLQLKREHKKALKAVSLSGFLLMAAFSMVQYFSHKSLNTQWDISQQIAQHGQENPDELAQMMSYQNEHDFFVDVASLSLDHLTKEQFESLLKSSSTR